MTPAATVPEYAIIDRRKRFDNAIQSLVTESCRAYHHWNLLLHINESSEEYIREINQTVFFWNTVQRSLQDGVILRIATMLDPRKDVVSMPSILGLINIHARGNGSKLGIELDNFKAVKIEDDIKSVHKFDPVVDKILTLRNEFIAHRSVNVVATHRLNLLPEIKNEEIDAILDLLYELSTKYAMLYGFNRTSRHMIGSDDYKQLFKALRKGFALNPM